eukprot:CFRG1975T1
MTSNVNFTLLRHGAVVRVKTSADEVLGEVYTYDETNHILMLRLVEEGVCDATFSKQGKYMLIDTTDVKEIFPLGGNPQQNPELKALNMERVKQRYAKAVHKARENAAKINKNVSSDDQALFNCISKTLPCSWEGSTMVVLDTIKINPPYVPENCSGDNVNMLNRVRMVVEGERRRLQNLH